MASIYRQPMKGNYVSFHLVKLRRKTAVFATGTLAAITVLAGCGSHDDESDDSAQKKVTVENCDKDVSFQRPVEKVFVNDSNMVSMMLAIGAAEKIAAISGTGRDTQLLKKAYGEETVDDLHVANKEYPTLENVIASKPDMMFAGWNYGYDEEQKLTPEGLAKHNIDSYTLSESCRKDGGDARGTMPPWKALTTDLSNLGKITGQEDKADSVVADIKERLDDLNSAPDPDSAPTALLFDSGTKDVMTSGSYGAPQAIINAAGAKNAASDIDDTWTSISWERIATASPDFVVFVDYPGQSFEEKVKLLKENSATKDLPAVQEERFLNLPIGMWTSGPLNIDAAELLRKSFEKDGLVPKTDIKPELDVPQQ